MMQRRLIALFLPFALVSLLLVTSGCDKSRLNDRMNYVSHKSAHKGNTMMGSISKTRRNYDYLQKSGGLVIRLPKEQEDGSFFLPVYADLTGASNGADRPNTQRDHAAVRDVIVEVDELDPSRLYLHVITAWKNERAPSSLIQGVNLGILAPGAYTVEYQDRNGRLTPLTAFQVN